MQAHAWPCGEQHLSAAPPPLESLPLLLEGTHAFSRPLYKGFNSSVFLYTRVASLAESPLRCDICGGWTTNSRLSPRGASPRRLTAARLPGTGAPLAARARRTERLASAYEDAEMSSSPSLSETPNAANATAAHIQVTRRLFSGRDPCARQFHRAGLWFAGSAAEPDRAPASSISSDADTEFNLLPRTATSTVSGAERRSRLDTPTAGASGGKTRSADARCTFEARHISGRVESASTHPSKSPRPHLASSTFSSKFSSKPRKHSRRESDCLSGISRYMRHYRDRIGQPYVSGLWDTSAESDATVAESVKLGRNQSCPRFPNCYHQQIGSGGVSVLDVTGFRDLQNSSAQGRCTCGRTTSTAPSPGSASGSVSCGASGAKFSGASGDSSWIATDNGEEVDGLVYGCEETRAQFAQEEAIVAKRVTKQEFAPLQLARCYREVNILRHLSHPHIIRLLAAHNGPEELWMFFEHAPFGDLYHRTKLQTLSENHARRIIFQLLTALVFVHSFGLVHGDIKPHNVLLFPSPQQSDAQLHESCVDGDSEATSPDIQLDWDTVVVKICDFGLSQSLDKDGMIEFAGVLGTQNYIAPEVLKNENYDAKIDTWALGIIAFELLGGYEPFFPPSASRTAPLEFDERYWRHVSPQAKDCIRKLLDRDVAARLSAVDAVNHPWFLPPPEV